jgi:3-phosphoshikimate 1-carboxyvinyltransferase
MGAAVTIDDDAITVAGGHPLRGVAADLRDFSDTAQTLAVTAVFAEGPTEITGIGFIRGKETDRIGALVQELGRCGIKAEERPDGLVVHPGEPHGAVVETYDDHRMAMSFALLGLRVPGVAIANPGCVAKTFPRYFDVLDSLRG